MSTSTMKLKDAVYKMKPGDYFIPSEKHYTKMIMAPNGVLESTTSGDNVSLSRGNMEIDGEIIPAKPKVLTADESLEKHFCKDYIPGDFKDGYRSGFSHGHKNGRLKMLIDLQEKWSYESIEDFGDYLESLEA